MSRKKAAESQPPALPLVELVRVLADREPHSVEQIAERVRAIVPPEMAMRKLQEANQYYDSIPYDAAVTLGLQKIVIATSGIFHPGEIKITGPRIGPYKALRLVRWFCCVCGSRHATEMPQDAICDDCRDVMQRWP